MSFQKLMHFTRDFETRFKALADSASLATSGDLVPVKNDSDRFKITSLFILRNVDLRAGSSKKKKLNIFVSYQGLLDDSGDIIKYTTKVNYSSIPLSSSPTDIETVHGLHYDFEQDGQFLHPVYHLQHDLNLLDPEIGAADYTINNRDSTQSPIRVDLRIPTSHMDVYSVLLMILADHVIAKDNDKQVDDFRNLIEFTITRGPKFNISDDAALHDGSLLISNDAHSAYWYSFATPSE